MFHLIPRSIRISFVFRFEKEPYLPYIYIPYLFNRGGAHPWENALNVRRYRRGFRSSRLPLWGTGWPCAMWPHGLACLPWLPAVFIELSSGSKIGYCDEDIFITSPGLLATTRVCLHSLSGPLGKRLLPYPVGTVFSM